MRACSALTKAGDPCPAAPLHGHDTCMGHADEATRTAAGFTPEAGHLGGRKARPKQFDVWRGEIETKFNDWKRPYEEALHAIKDDGSPDHVIRMKAADSVLDRVYGKPTTRTELSGPDGGAITIEGLAVLAAQGLPADFEIESTPEPVSASRTA